ncbi:hypothetical protein TCAL_14293 [Tigriopus californicus]|uniref:Uncharacterized protein n=1 Tax=Tigriopus californicus TaxID=6832 RepID=A0A553NET8_TIGCA|nr:uncharacterized protein LOC131887918 [Tigriopus californicus]TRY63925.1 hypothetical protein TCAL_14293 [Tigriopus californicus]
MSDTVSLNSNQSADVSALGGIVVEEVGQLPILEFVPKKLVLLNYTFAALNEEGRLLLGEIRTRGGDDWTLAARSITQLSGKPGEDRKYLDLALVPNVHQGGTSIVFLVEKKNKERLITAHNIKHGKILTLEDEFTSYDKVNVLGKGVSHITADVSAPEPTVFSVSTLLRKLRLEDGGSTLKPTPARAQVPAEGQDGTLSMAIQPAAGMQKHHHSTVVISFRTKSATKNKFMIEWYQSRKDEMSCLKSAIKFGEDCEPHILLSDPKDTRTVYAVCRNHSNSSTNIFKIIKGKKPDDPILSLNYDVDMAAMGMSADQNVTLLLYSVQHDSARIYFLSKTDGFRGKHPICVHCPPLELFSSPSHIISCVTHRWQLPASLVDKCVGSAPYQLALVTLVDSNGRYAIEPETGHGYRLRILGCDTQGFTPESILLEDLERTFENAEDKLAHCTLKICINQTPCNDRLSQLSAWLMSGRLAAIEMQFVKTLGGLPSQGSDRFTIKPISPERFRSYMTDMDWSQMNQKQGTFTLDSSNSSTHSEMSASINRSLSKIPVSRIPSATPSLSGSHHGVDANGDNGHLLSYHNASIGDRTDSRNEGEDSSIMREQIDQLSSSLSQALRENSNLTNNLSTMQRALDSMRQRVGNGTPNSTLSSSFMTD